MEDKLTQLLEIEKEDSNTKFLLSLAEQMGRLTKKQNNLARMRFQQTLFDLEFGTN